MFKRFLAFTLLIALSLGLASPTFAQVPSPTPTPKIENVNSFELFWPMAPGKTMADSLYFLKSLKEKIRGLLIFGTPQKVNYSVYLSTKRILEAEKLYNDKNKDLGNKTMDEAIKDLNKAVSQNSKGTDETSDRLARLDKFLTWFTTKNSADKSKIQDALSLVKKLLG
ncbi:MAG: hypothetical protein HY044_02865 [Candidatus Woesebacteria bacterium]|nr:MAG: hypothetical protein HY044_02865 [Candidatus Woesebacteria bacterium]